MVEKKRFKQGLMSPLVLCLITILILPGCSFSKGHREGVHLTVNTTGGDSVKGELLMVKDDDSLFIVSRGHGVNIPAKKIRGIKVRKPGGKTGRSALGGFGYGALIGAGGAGLLYSKSQMDVPITRKGLMIVSGAFFSILGSISAYAKKYTRYHLYNKTPGQIKKILTKIKNKAGLDSPSTVPAQPAAISLNDSVRRSKKNDYFIEGGTIGYYLFPSLWTAGLSMDLRLKKSLVLTPEATVMGRESFLLGAPALLLNYKTKSFFTGAGIMALMPLRSEDTNVLFPLFKVNVGIQLGKVKLALYTIRSFRSSEHEDLEGVLGISAGFKF